jgi:hypothetical protein
MKVQSQITRVAKTTVQSTNNIAITMQNGDVQWVNKKYCDAILSSLFLDGAMPTALVGSSVSYEKSTHKIGDKVLNDKGEVVKVGNDDKLFTKDGYRINNFRVEETGAKAQELEQVGFKIALKNSLKTQLSGLSLKKAEVPAPAPTTSVEEPVTETVAADDIA